MSSKFKRAFSAIELSIVILIVGIVIVGITQSGRLLQQFKIVSAQNLTDGANSQIGAIKDLEMWLETTSNKSIAESESYDGARVTNWYDISPLRIEKHNATGSGNSRPIYYENCINDLPCLRFNGASFADGAYDKLDFDGSFLVGTDYTVFVVEQTDATTPGFFIGHMHTFGFENPNTGLEFGYVNNEKGLLRISHGYTQGEFYAVEIPTYSVKTPVMHTYTNGTIESGSVNLNYYFNGADSASTKAAGTGTQPSTLVSYSQAAIGVKSSAYYFTGDIGEIIIFTRKLSDVERATVSNYLLKKWSIKKG